ncbi:MAG: pyruvate formate lyase family protein [Candidatus Bathyarchaeia archaeon]
MTFTVRLSERNEKRIKKLMAKIVREKFPLCTDKVRLIVEAYRMTEGYPEIIRQATAIAHVLDNIPIWIDDDEQIVGHGASKPYGVELDVFYGLPSEEEVIKAVKEGIFSVDEKDWPIIKELLNSKEWKKYALTARGFAPLDERLGDFLKTGIWLPPQEARIEAMGHFGSGLDLISKIHLSVPNFKKVLNYGLNHVIKEAEEELKNLRFFSPEDIEKRLFLEAMIIALRAVIRFANRYADLAEKIAASETDPIRRMELERIAETCRWVPANPARNFYEAIQSYWFTYLVHNPSNVIGMGRFDQLMYPFYKKDKEADRITDEEVLALLCELRIKDMELISMFITKEKRKQFSGFAKWHNMVIGGVTPDGKDATNELTYLVLEAAKIVRTPHHTITLRVHEGTPEDLMLKALEVVKTGIGMPAFVGDKSYIETLLSNGVPVKLARDYTLAGCLDVVIPSVIHRINATFFASIKVFEIFMNGGLDPRTGIHIGPFKVNVEEFQTFEEFYDAFKQYYDYFVGLWVECTNLTCWAWSKLWTHIIEAALLDENIKQGKPFYEYKLPYDMAAVMYPVGLINVANSLAAIKKLVFEEKKITMRQLKEALAANWRGYEDIRKMCLQAPKYGNDDDYVDQIAADLYKLHADLARKYNFIFGGKVFPGGISITSMWAAGEITGATPDGRFAGEVTADGTHSPQQGTDVNGPTAVIKSASKIDQTPYLCTLLNMKFHPSALRTVEDLRKLAVLIKTYFSLGGKHIQFNVVDRETLLDAQKHPEKYQDLIVRVAGYSAYFTQLSKPVQDEIIKRTEHNI